MFDTILRNSAGMEFKTIMILLAVSLVLGILVAAVYMLTDKSAGKPYLTALVILPVIVCAVVSLVNGNLGAAIAVAGSFTLVRFRSQQGTAKELAILFFDMALGLSAASGYIFFTVVFAVLVLLILIVLTVVNFGGKAGAEKMLKISMPDTLDFEEAFNEVFEKYTDNAEVDTVKTANKDTAFEVRYVVRLKKDVDTRAFLKELSAINSDLPITLTGVVKKAEKDL